MHYGKAHDDAPPGRGSGRYPYGSGKRQHQHSWDVMSRIEKLEAQEEDKDDNDDSDTELSGEGEPELEPLGAGGDVFDELPDLEEPLEGEETNLGLEAEPVEAGGAEETLPTPDELGVDMTQNF